MKCQAILANSGGHNTSSNRSWGFIISVVWIDAIIFSLLILQLLRYDSKRLIALLLASRVTLLSFYNITSTNRRCYAPLAEQIVILFEAWYCLYEVYMEPFQEQTT